MLYPHCSATFFLCITLCSQISLRNALSCWEFHPTTKNPLAHSTHHSNDITDVHTLNIYCCYLYTINWTNVPYINVITDACATCKQQQAKLSCTLAKVGWAAKPTVKTVAKLHNKPHNRKRYGNV